MARMDGLWLKKSPRRYQWGTILESLPCSGLPCPGLPCTYGNGINCGVRDCRVWDDTTGARSSAAPLSTPVPHLSILDSTLTLDLLWSPDIEHSSGVSCRSSCSHKPQAVAFTDATCRLNLLPSLLQPSHGRLPTFAVASTRLSHCYCHLPDRRPLLRPPHGAVWWCLDGLVTISLVCHSVSRRL